MGKPLFAAAHTCTADLLPTASLAEKVAKELLPIIEKEPTLRTG
jgi:hypothetical protein